ncbi:MAG: hypothetical protein KAI83_04795 [Thiomargarita sp.]|nr:hypothetical protein [Thiomargarita sp.]
MDKTNSYTRFQLTIASLFFLILIGTAGIYWAGLQGTFLLDDSHNLENLEHINQSTDKWTEIVRFSTEGISSRLGRPVSLFTFALQAHNASFAWYLKYVNLMIHLLNGCLIFWLLLYITRIMALPEKRALLLALFTTSLWLLHPFQVSTVLYVIQRMTELSALFTLAALLIYVRSRYQFAQGRLTPTAFWISISIGIGLGGILATLSKENGVLLVLYVLVLEATILRSLPKPRYWQMWSWVFLYLPLLALASYFILHFDNLLKGYEIRHFTLGERLLTETRILSEYLFKILIPRPQYYGLFHDDFSISHSLLTPITTLFAVGFTMLMFFAGLFWRKKYPVFALAVLWFFAGHILESSFIGLMLYFEHRNYLPMLGILFASVYAILWIFDRMKVASLRKAAISFTALYLLLFSLVTWLETDLWSKPLVQTMVWAEEHPYSRIAQAQAAAASLSLGNEQKTLEYYRHMVTAFPEDSGPYAIWLHAATCVSANIPLPDMQKVIQRFKTSKGDNATFNALKSILDLHAKEQCTHLNPKTINTLLKTAVESSMLATTYRDKFYLLYAIFYSIKGQYNDAIDMADKSLSLAPNRNLQFQRILWLQMEDRYVEALEEIAKIRANLNLLSDVVYLEDLKRGEKIIRKLMESTTKSTTN